VRLYFYFKGFNYPLHSTAGVYKIWSLSRANRRPEVDVSTNGTSAGCDY
jgi:hypothetical protein